MTILSFLSALFWVVKVLNSSCVVGGGVFSAFEEWGGEGAMTVEKGVVDSFKALMLSSLRV